MGRTNSVGSRESKAPRLRSRPARGLVCRFGSRGKMQNLHVIMRIEHRRIEGWGNERRRQFVCVRGWGHSLMMICLGLKGSTGRRGLQERILVPVAPVFYSASRQIRRRPRLHSARPVFLWRPTPRIAAKLVAISSNGLFGAIVPSPAIRNPAGAC